MRNPSCLCGMVTQTATCKLLQLSIMLYAWAIDVSPFLLRRGVLSPAHKYDVMIPALSHVPNAL